MSKRLRIESDGTPRGARVLIDGQLVEHVVAATVEICPDQITATITVLNPELAIDINDTELAIPITSMDFRTRTR